MARGRNHPPTRRRKKKREEPLSALVGNLADRPEKPSQESTALRRIRPFFVLTAAVAITLFGVPGVPGLPGVPSVPEVAMASNFGGCNAGARNTPCFAEDRQHLYSMSLGPRLGAATVATYTQSYETTDLVTGRESPGSVNADVHYFVDDSLPANVLGRYDCTRWLSGGRCEHALIRYHGEEVAGFSDARLQALACHETGHSVGLRHPPNTDTATYGCMVNPVPNVRHMGAHNANHINSRY
jgi:hypothetical protein